MNGSSYSHFLTMSGLAPSHTSIVAQPPDVDGVLLLFLLKQDYLVHDTFGQLVSFRVSIGS
jgi:hypothetical protein